jgi:DNA repair photolyase
MGRTGRSGALDNLFKDASRSIITYNESRRRLRREHRYRGCEHGCIYCFARPNHEYLGVSGRPRFRVRILVRTRTGIETELMAPRWKPQPIAISGVTDAYQPSSAG